MAEATEALGLEKPLETEFYDVKVFNDNADKIDAAVKSLQQARNALGELLEDLQRAHEQDIQEVNLELTEVMALAESALPAASYTAADILAKLKTVDGAGSGLDADLFKGKSTIPISSGGTGATTAADARTNLGITPYSIGARPLRQSGAYGISTPAIGQEVWWKLGEVNCTGTYFTYQFKLLVIGNGVRGITELTALIRTGTTSGVLSTGETYLYINNLNTGFGVGSALPDIANPNNYAIDNSTAGKAVLYLKLPNSSYLSMHLIVLAETFSTSAASDNSEKFIFAPQYYGGSPVEGTHYQASITQTIVGKQLVIPVGAGGTGNTTGLAASATKLATARTIRTNLASTSTASFNGSANITPGVTGILPQANGGTGASSLATAINNLLQGGSISGVRMTTSGNIASGASAAVTVTNSSKCLVNFMGASEYNNYLTVTKTSTTKLTITNNGSGVAGYQVVEYY